jgi:hypothetical protein
LRASDVWTIVRAGNKDTTMQMTIHTHTFLVEAAPAATTPCAAKPWGFVRRSNDVLALVGRYAS